MLREDAERALKVTHASIPALEGVSRMVVTYLTGAFPGRVVVIRYQFDEKGIQRVKEWRDVPISPGVPFGPVKKYGFGSLYFGP
jgi:hypothetical protein